MKTKCAIVVLAAGKSSRMKRCKLNVEVSGKTLLENTLSAALQSMADIIVVVSGAYKDEVIAATTNLNVDVIHNANFESGIASSIKCGIAFLQKRLDIDKIIISVADQVYISGKIFNKLIEKSNENSNLIIVSSYKNVFGVPCLFPQNYWNLLENLTGDEGARKVLNSKSDLLASVAFPAGWLDIDNPSDLTQLIQ